MKHGESNLYISDQRISSLLANFMLWRQVFVGGFSESNRFYTT